MSEFQLIGKGNSTCRPVADGYPNRGSTSVCYATRRYHDDEGGNPFATTLIEFSSAMNVPIAEFRSSLRHRTIEISDRHQEPEFVGPDPMVDWRRPLTETDRQGGRAALVLVVSDYRASQFNSLAGAARDEQRISAMLQRTGYSVTSGVGSSRDEIRRPYLLLFLTFVSSIVLGGLTTRGAEGWITFVSLVVTASLFVGSWSRFQGSAR